MKKLSVHAAAGLTYLLTTAALVWCGDLDTYYLGRFVTPDSAGKTVSASAGDAGPADCGTPLMHGLRLDWDQLAPDTRKTLAKYVAAPVLADEATFLSADGHFLIHYATSGADLPVPGTGYTLSSWIQTVADAFEYAYSFYKKQGYDPPPSTQPGAPYHVYLRNLAGKRIYGQAVTTQPTPLSGHIYSYASYIEIDKDFTNAIFRVFTPLENLQITSAHEFHHAIQYGYNFFFDLWYAEATSTWFEDEVHPLVHQSYSYVRSWFANSAKSLDAPLQASTLSEGAGYGRWVFNRFITGFHGPAVVRLFWEKMGLLNPTAGSSRIPAVSVLDAVLSKQFGSNIATAFTGLAKRVYLRDWTTDVGDIDRIPTYVPVTTYGSYPVNAGNPMGVPAVTLPRLSFAYYSFDTTTYPGNSMTITLNGTSGISAVAFKTEAATGTTTAYDFTSLPSAVTIPGLAGTSQVVLLIVNSDPEATHNANFSTDGSTQPLGPVVPTPLAKITEVTPGTTPGGSNTGTDTTTTAGTDAGAGASPSGGGGGCFIATAAYGSYLHPHVRILRAFRDQYLLTNSPGRTFVAAYYRLSPPLADYISRHEPLKVMVRLLLTPLVWALTYPTGYGLCGSGGLYLLLILLRGGRARYRAAVG